MTSREVRIELMLQGCLTIDHPRPNTKQPLLAHPELMAQVRYIERELNEILAQFGGHSYIGVHEYRIREDEDDES